MVAKLHSIYRVEMILAVSCLPNRDIERINEDPGVTMIVTIEMHS